MTNYFAVQSSPMAQVLAQSNLFVSVLKQLGIEDHTFGNSTSSLKGLEIG